jgi:hypothetical protein
MRNQNLSRNFIKQIFTFILVTIILFGALPIEAQTKRGTPKTVKASEKKTASTEPNTNSAETSFAKPSNSVMSQSWQSGELPQPLPTPAGSTDEVAAILAQKVAARNQESVPALLTALQLSGFYVTDKKGEIALAPPGGKGQGLVINGWEVASAARMYGGNRTVNLAHLDAQLMSVPILRRIPAEQQGKTIGAALMQGIAKQADNKSNPYLRVWARFIIELGKNSAGKYDLQNSSNAAINLDAIQHLLIMRRLYGDFWATAERFKNQKAGLETQNQTEVRFEKAGFNRNSAAHNLQAADFGAPTADEPKQNEKCRFEGDMPSVLDGIAASFGFGWDEVLERLADGDDEYYKGKASKYAAFLSVANILLVYAKFIQTYAALEATITAEDSAPLVRTKNAVPGARKKLKAFVRMNIGEWQSYNCMRTIMNFVSGLDFATLNDGPLSGVGVQWGLTQGGAGDFYSNSTGINQSGEQIVGFTAENPKRIQDKGVGAGRGLGNLTFNKTDDKGTTEIILEGTPQRNAKLGKVNQVRKNARVTTAIEIKPGEIKGDMVDVYGQWLGGLGGLLEMPAELLYRTSWAAGGALDVPVIDWEECTGAWTGTVSFVKTFNRDENKVTPRVSGRGENRIKTESDWTYKADIQVGGKNAQAAIDFNDTFNETRDAFESNSCDRGKTWRDMSCSIKTQSYRTATGNADASVQIGVNHQNGTFSISGGTAPITGKTGGEETGKCSNQCVPKIIKPKTFQPSTVEIEGQSFRIPEQQFEPNSNTISGSYTSPTELGWTLIVTWSLQKCGAQAALNPGETNVKFDATALLENEFFQLPTFNFLTSSH